MPDSLMSPVKDGISVISAAIAGRMMYRARVRQKSGRKFFTADLAYEIPIAVGMGFVAQGVASYTGLDGDMRLALVAALSYLGPGGSEALIERWLRHKR